MGVLVREFKLTAARTRVTVGEPFEVDLTVSWTPIDQGGGEPVRIFCENNAYSAQPSSVDMHVEPLGGITTKRLRLRIDGPGGDLVDVIAKAESGSQDTLVLQVVV